jgi:hypothetical protein
MPMPMLADDTRRWPILFDGDKFSFQLFTKDFRKKAAPPTL